MKVLALTLILLSLSVATIAKERQWQDASVVSSSSGNSGAAVVPVGGMLIGVPLHRLYYRIETADIAYVVFVPGGRPLNVTIKGHTKLAVDGRNLHILDDGGKDVKLPIVQKVAK